MARYFMALARPRGPAPEQHVVVGGAVRVEAIGRLEARRDDIRKIVRARLGDETLANRAASLPEHLLEDAFDHVLTDPSPTDLTNWLDTHNA